MTDAERRAALDAIAAEVAVCTRCRLHQTRTRAVPGEGTAATEVMFVGEGPGFNEDRQGRPFVGQAGALLGELLGSVGWSRDEVFITNVVKCRPPENRDPEPDEITSCAPFLTRQLAALDPALIVTLGRFSMARFNPGARIGQVHGTFRPADAASGAPEALTYAMYHPAAALHQGSLKATLFRDMEGVPAALLEARGRRSSIETAPEAAPPSSEAERAAATTAAEAKTTTSTNGSYARLAGAASNVLPAAPEAATGLPETAPAAADSPRTAALESPDSVGSELSAAESDPTDQLTLF
ncbi:MAG: uracil-DNA glycosylase family protein [Candidatus Limnocylindrales bacterium]